MALTKLLVLAKNRLLAVRAILSRRDDLLFLACFFVGEELDEVVFLALLMANIDRTRRVEVEAPPLTIGVDERNSLKVASNGVLCWLDLTLGCFSTVLLVVLASAKIIKPINISIILIHLDSRNFYITFC